MPVWVLCGGPQQRQPDSQPARQAARQDECGRKIR